jgi:adenylate kinase family enzyme
MKLDFPHKRIMIFGRPGSGKSTFALKLHNITKIPLYHLDKYFFIANWQKRDNEEFMQMQYNIVNSDAWIVDGNCTKSLETRYSHADLCLYYNYSKFLCLWRIFKRLFNNRSHFDDRAENCPELVRWQLVKYMWTFEKRVQLTIEDLKIKYPQVRFIKVANDRQSKQILDGIM